MFLNTGRGGGIADTQDSKSCARKSVRVQVPLSAHMKKRLPDKDFIWTPALAYAVGLIVTDGNLSSDGRHIIMRSSEKQLLETYKHCLQLKSIKIGTSYSSGHTNKPSYRVQHGDVRLYRWLEKIGITAHKTHTIGAIAVPDEMFLDFLRGHLDGDGSITTYTDRWNTFKNPNYVYERLWLRFLSASEAHMLWLQKRIEKVVSTKGHLNKRVPRDSRHVPMYSLKFGKKDSMMLLKHLYPNKRVPCLKRKRKIAEPFLSRI